MTARKKRFLFIGLVVVVLVTALGAYLIHRHSMFDPSTLPDPPDPSIPKERSVAFMGKTYQVFYSGTTESEGNTYDSWQEQDYRFTYDRNTSNLVQVYRPNIAHKDDYSVTFREDMRKLAYDAAKQLTTQALTHYTVLEREIVSTGCGHEPHNGTTHFYQFMWIYGSEDPKIMTENSFLLCLDISGVLLNYLSFGARQLDYHIFPDTPAYMTYLQLSTTVPFPPYFDKEGLRPSEPLPVNELDDIALKFVQRVTFQPADLYRIQRSKKFTLTEEWETYGSAGPFYDYRFFYIGEVTQSGQRQRYSYFIRIHEDGSIVETRLLTEEELANWIIY